MYYTLHSAVWPVGGATTLLVVGEGGEGDHGSPGRGGRADLQCRNRHGGRLTVAAAQSTIDSPVDRSYRGSSVHPLLLTRSQDPVVALKSIRRWRAAGYRVAIIYLWVPTADHCVARVARRVREGGHHIPEAVIRRRFERSWRNFRDLYRRVVDEWRVYDNSGEVPVLLEESEEWNAVREPGTKWPPSGPTQRTTDVGRRQMTEQPWRFPEGEPSHKSILAALVLARKDAMRRVAEYEAQEAANEAGGGDGEAQLTQTAAERELP